MILELEYEIMMAFGTMYLQYYLNVIIMEDLFFLHLNVIKLDFYVVHKTTKGIMVPPLLNPHLLDI